MLHRYRAGVIPAPAGSTGAELRAVAARLPGDLARALGEDHDPRAALDVVFALIAHTNRHVEVTRPWALAREGRARGSDAARRLDTVLYELGEVCRLVAEGLRPLLPDAAGGIATALGVSLATSWTDGLEWGRLRPGQPVGRPGRLFPRPDLEARGLGAAIEPAPF